MKTINVLSKLTAIVLVVVFMSSCKEKIVEVEATTYTISGVVNYPDFSGASTLADGAVVYLKLDATEATTSYDLTTIADATGKYTFSSIPDGSYFVFANYDTDNTNNPGGRMAGVIFGGEGGVVTVAGANATQDISLVSIGQADAFAVNTFDQTWSADWGHSNIDFSFPYDDGNATYTGSLELTETYIQFDPFSLGSSKIEATIDLLSITTDSPGGRDPLYNSDGTLWQDPTTSAYKLGCVAGTFGIANNDPTDPDRYATFNSTSIEVYGDGYLATGPLVFNGVTTVNVSMFFKFIPGFVGTNRAGATVQFSSFQGSFDIAAFADYGIVSGHIGETNNVTIDVSLQVNKIL